MDNEEELSPEEKAYKIECDQMNLLFDDIYRVTGKAFNEVFCDAFLEQSQKQLHEAVLKFMTDVSSCPDYVKKYGQKILYEKQLENGKKK